jgi:hypothetical protein
MRGMATIVEAYGLVVLRMAAGRARAAAMMRSLRCAPKDFDGGLADLLT